MTDADVPRREPGRLSDERELLEGWLDYYRATLIHKCAGLSPAQLAEAACPPSRISLLGLVRHLTEMERVYLHRLVQPDLPMRYVTEASPDGDFDDATPATAEADLAVFAEHLDRSHALCAARPFDAHLRWNYLYLIKEYARHLGHADLVRERVDGATGE